MQGQQLCLHRPRHIKGTDISNLPVPCGMGSSVYPSLCGSDVVAVFQGWCCLLSHAVPHLNMCTHQVPQASEGPNTVHRVAQCCVVSTEASEVPF